MNPLTSRDKSIEIRDINITETHVFSLRKKPPVSQGYVNFDNDDGPVKRVEYRYQIVRVFL